MRRSRFQADLLFSVALFFLFLCCVLGSLFLGVKAYRSSASQLDRGFSASTALLYISGRLRENDRPGGLTLETWEGGDLLCLPQEKSGKSYLTYLYCKDGGLWELLSPADREFAPENGRRLLDLEALEISSPAPGLYTITCTHGQGAAVTTALSLRSEVAP